MLTSNFREQDQKINSLERQNLDLKMQVYYLNQKLIDAQESDKAVVDHSTASYTDTSRLKEELLLAQRRIQDLEHECEELKSSKALESQFDSTKATQLLQVEENRKQERSAALLIAENDTIVIQQLEREITALKQQHASDVALVGDFTDRLGALGREKDAVAANLSAEKKTNMQLQQKISLLVDRIRRLDLSVQRQSMGLSSITGTGIYDSSSSSAPLGSGNTASASINQLMADILASDTYAPEPPASPIITTSSSSSSTSLALVTHDKSADSNNKSDREALALQSAAVSTVAPQDFLDFGARTAWTELNSLRRENKHFRVLLARERELLKTQEEALKLMQHSFRETKRVEASNVARLESELDLCLDELEKWRAKCLEYEGEGGAEGDGDGEGDGNTKHRRSAMQHQRENQHDADNWDLGSKISLTDELGDVSRIKDSGGGRKDKGRRVGGGTISVSEHNKTIDMYRLREAELLKALEDVIIRCQDLERRNMQTH